MSLSVGAKVKIVKGTHKGKWGYVFIIKDSFVQVKVQEYIKCIAKGDSEDVVEERVVRAKKSFVVKIPDTIIEMPDANQLQPVPHLDEDYVLPENNMSESDQELVAKILADMPLPKDDEDILSQHESEGEAVDISGGLDVVEDALSLKELCDTQGNEIHRLEDKLVNMGIERVELAEAVDMFIKLADYIRGRLEGLQ